MGDLREADVRRLLACLEQVYAFLDSRPFAERAARAVAGLVPCNASAFTAADRLLMDLVRPHLDAACRLDARLTHVADALQALDLGLEATSHAVMMVDGQGRILASSALARVWCRLFFGASTAARTLAEPLRGWLRANGRREARVPLASPHTPFVCDGPGGRLSVVWLRDDERGRRILLFEKRDARAWERAFGDAGVTAREAQVLHWLALGKSNRDIATLLDVRLGTVRKHLERIYAKLGVENRNGAVARALELVEASRLTGG